MRSLSNSGLNPLEELTLLGLMPEEITGETTVMEILPEQRVLFENLWKKGYIEVSNWYEDNPSSPHEIVITPAGCGYVTRLIKTNFT